MQGIALKLTALAASLAVGFVVLLQVQQNLKTPQPVSAESDAAAFDSQASAADPFDTAGDQFEPVQPVLGQYADHRNTSGEIQPVAFHQDEPTTAPQTKPAAMWPHSEANIQPAVAQSQPEFQPVPAGSSSRAIQADAAPVQEDPFAAFTRQLNDRIDHEQTQATQKVQDFQAKAVHVVEQIPTQLEPAREKVNAFQREITQVAHEVVEKGAQTLGFPAADESPARLQPAPERELVALNAPPVKGGGFNPFEPEPEPLPAKPANPAPTASKPPAMFPSLPPIEENNTPAEPPRFSAFPTEAASVPATPATPAAPINRFPGAFDEPAPVNDSASPELPAMSLTPAQPAESVASPPAGFDFPSPEPVPPSTPAVEPAMLPPAQPEPTKTPSQPFFDSFNESESDQAADGPYRLVPQFNAGDAPATTKQAETMTLPPVGIQPPAAPKFETQPQFDASPKFEAQPELTPEPAPKMAAPEASDPFGAFPANPAPSTNPLAAEPEPLPGFPGMGEPEPTPARSAATAPEISLAPLQPENPFGATREPAPAAFPGAETSAKPLSEPEPSAPAKPASEMASQPKEEPQPTPVSDIDPELIGSAQVKDLVTESVQQPKIDLLKSAPENAVLGQPLVYSIEVVNSGDVSVRDVTVEDQFPAGTKLTGTIPRAELVNKTLVWKFPELKPGEKKKILIRVVPIESGDIGSISTVSYKSMVAAQTRVTAPKLELKITPRMQEVAIGESVELDFVVSNSGLGEARDVILRNLIPAGLEHPAGSDLEYEIGLLKGGEKKEITLAVTARQVGQHENQATIKSSAGMTADARTSLKVIPAVMSLSRSGPSRRFVGHQAKFDSVLINNTQRTLTNVTVVEQIPEGFEFQSASDGGVYHRSQRTVSWTYSELKPEQECQLALTLIPREIGTRELRLTAQDSSGNQAEIASKVKVEGFASLAVRVPEDRGPVPKGERFSLRYKVVNRGSAEASQVVVTCNVPGQLEYLSSNGPSKAQHSGRTVQFLPIASLPAGQELTFDLVFVAQAAGDVRVEFEVASEQTTAPIRHQEQVVIYAEE